MKKGYRKILRIFLIVLAVLVLFVGALQLSFTFYFNSKIISDLQEAVLSETNGEYQLEIGELKTNIFSQSVYISRFRLLPQKNTNPDNARYYASATEINLVNCSLFSFLFRKKLTISRIEVTDPAGYIYRSTNKNSPTQNSTDEKFSLYALINKNIQELKIHKIDISNAHIAIYENLKDSIPSVSSKDNEVLITNLSINKSVDEAGRLFFADKINLTMNRFAYTTRDSLYTFKAKQLRASYTDSILTVDSLELIPNYSKRQFSGEAGKQTDRMNVTVAGLNFVKMDVKLFFERNWFIAKQLDIEGLNLSAYRNKNYARKPERIKSVQELLKDIPLYSAIEKIELHNAFIVYEEVAEGAAKAGRISFEKVNAGITGFTSDSTLFATKKALEVKATALFMNKGKLTGHYSFPLNTSDMVFDCSGKLTDMPLEAINPILEPNAKVSIKAGMIDSLVFAFHANARSSDGKMRFYYHGLKMEFLNKKDLKAGKLEEVLSFLAHRILIKEENPSRNQPVRVTDISYNRNPNRFIFNYSWKSLLSGIKPAIGIPGGK